MGIFWKKTLEWNWNQAWRFGGTDLRSHSHAVDTGTPLIQDQLVLRSKTPPPKQILSKIPGRLSLVVATWVKFLVFTEKNKAATELRSHATVEAAWSSLLPAVICGPAREGGFLSSLYVCGSSMHAMNLHTDPSLPMLGALLSKNHIFLSCRAWHQTGSGELQIKTPIKDSSAGVRL